MIRDFPDFSMPGNPDDYSAGRTTWGYLAPHLEHGTLLYVDPSLDMRAVAAAISADETEKVAAWLESGDLVKLGEIHARQWNAATATFDAMVISPFVLCRPAVPTSPIGPV